jgi:hypothetical protein
VSDDADSVQMLQRTSQIGEFYTMSLPATATVGANTNDILVYDEESDMLKQITWERAVNACPLDLAAVKAAFGDAAIQALGDLTGDAAKRALAIIVVRPFIEHNMTSAVVAVAGRDTGATLFGPADMQISANTSVKTIEGYACIFELTHTPVYVPLLTS